MTYLAHPRYLLCFTLTIAACTGETAVESTSSGASTSSGGAETEPTGTDTGGSETAAETSEATTDVAVTSTSSSSGGFDSACSDEGCHHACSDFCGYTGDRPWDCDLPEICPALSAGDKLVAGEYIEAAHCLLQALRDGTVGKIAFGTSFYSDNRDFDASVGAIFVLPGRQVVVDVIVQSGGGLSRPACSAEHSKVLDIVGMGSSSWATCLESDVVEELMTCTGIGSVSDGVTPPHSAVDFPWLAGTCGESTDACP